MRVLITLQAQTAAGYDSLYHDLQGFFYSLLKRTKYKGLHAKRGYKFFCFSNIFPPKAMEQGEVRYLLFSSPRHDLVEGVYETLREKEREEETITIGWMRFKVHKLSLVDPDLSRRFTLRTGTPIVIRIPQEKYGSYCIEPPKPYEYVYWRKRYSLRAFIKQLEENLFKKFKEFHGERQPEFNVFQQLELKKTISDKVQLGGEQVTIIGSLWKFHFNGVDEQTRNLLKFGLATGFGELNSLGFGFMNIEK